MENFKVRDYNSLQNFLRNFSKKQNSVASIKCSLGNSMTIAIVAILTTAASMSL